MGKRSLFIFYKLLRGLTLLLGLSILTFILMKNSPIDPVMASVDYDTSMTPEQYEAIKEYWGLNKPPIGQYFSWLKSILSGNMGISRVHKRLVIEVIKEKALASAALMGVSWTLSGIIGIALGTIAAFNRGKLSDRIIKWFAYLQASVPTFWIGLIFLLIFSVKLGWFPIGISAPIGVIKSEVTILDKIHHLILPALTLSVLGIANVVLHTREKMIDVLNEEYVLFARARGESDFQIFKNHALRNAIVPAITIHFASFGELFGGSILAEQVFSYPGLGSTLTEAGLKSDMPLLLGIIMISAVFVFFGNMIGDIINSRINPYLKQEGQQA
ncbi:peptide/nickel transport system permease protein [Tissierella praeacuta DSM 18095]|uniref:Peptide/nickel transport system permease protein n=1 Tax=Tissierella praeacuta DSM 18095 TaxID=1123404 RepID=A0A1M4W9M2_9FIRM|nr:ABC transporter permease [Tissierella praeacuta]TCU75534.1 peptide/nickel transport system permease protein [Tissierella praeacuta]SHE77961.1 peptide/nickel transport system permease protein [Tissierella praeacuta DSM 18095]SUO99938.1 Dipeptide transport system permease protein dppB [Tissierella praeacuta]